jgi:hypothetical protein
MVFLYLTIPLKVQKSGCLTSVEYEQLFLRFMIYMLLSEDFLPSSNIDHFINDFLDSDQFNDFCDKVNFDRAYTSLVKPALLDFIAKD